MGKKKQPASQPVAPVVIPAAGITLPLNPSAVAESDEAGAMKNIFRPEAIPLEEDYARLIALADVGYKAVSRALEAPYVTTDEAGYVPSEG